jgi:predicted acylesterase/phospholipase RssA
VTLRVLSIDGGGVPGIVPARVLAELEELTGRAVSDQFDLIAGTSSGAILALALSVPAGGGAPRYRAAQLLEIHLEQAEKLFPTPSAARRLRRLLGFAPAGAPGSVARRLSELFGTIALGEARVEVIVPTLDLATAAPLIIRSGEFAGHSDPLMSDIALASAALPSHFAAVQIELSTRVVHLAHGGLVANNPSLIAYAAALGRADPAEVLIVSLGSGAPGPAHGLPPGPRAAHRWPGGAAAGLSAQMDSAGEAQHQMLASLLAAIGGSERYWRIQLPLDGYRRAGRRPDVEGLAMLADQLVEAQQTELRAVAEALA